MVDRRLAVVGAGCLVTAAVAAVGGAVFHAVHGDTASTRAIAYGMWFAAALCLVLILPAGSKRIWRRTGIPVVEAWMLVSASVFLTVLGAAVDALGS